MTTVVFKDGVLYSDSRVTSLESDGSIQYYFTSKKIFRTLKGCFGVCGNVAGMEEKVHYINGCRPNLLSGSNTIIHVWKGLVTLYEFDIHPILEFMGYHFSTPKKIMSRPVDYFQNSGKFIAIGSGSRFMKAALDSGASIEEAYRFTSIMDDYTDDNINQLEI